MKQKLLNDVLYVYSLEPYVIVKDTDASVIYVQEELFEEYRALNPTLTQLARKNFNLIAVIEPEWNEYIHEKVDPDFEWSAQSYTAQIGESNSFPVLFNQDGITPTYMSSDTDVAVISNEGEITLVNKGNCIITATYQGDIDWFNAKTVTYSLNVLSAKVNYIFESFSSDGSVRYGEGEAQSTGIETQTMIEIEVLYNHAEDPEAEDFVGQKFFITNEAVPDTDALYPLYNANGETVGISVKVNKTNKLDADLYWSANSATVQIGEINSFPTIVNNCDVDLLFSSSNNNVAVIDNLTGEITLVGGGEAIISAIFSGDAIHAAETQTYTLTVLAAKVSPQLSWSANSATVQLGETNSFPTLSNPNRVNLSYRSSDNSIAEIGLVSGEITLKAEGTVTISCTSLASQEYYSETVTYTLEVIQAKIIPNYVWNVASATVQIGEENVFPTLVNPQGIEVEYSSSDTDIVSFDEHNEFVLKQGGEVTISAYNNASTYYQAGMSQCTLHVLPAKVSPNLTWTDNAATVQIGETNTYPSLLNTNNVSISYTSSDTNVATIANDGTITLVAAGTATITASFSGNTTYQAQSVDYSLTVLAAKQNANISWSANSASVHIGATNNSFPVLSNPNNLAVQYSSSDTSIASIDSNGAITLNLSGQVTIEATFNGSTYFNPQSVTYTLTIGAMVPAWIITDTDPADIDSVVNPYTVKPSQQEIDMTSLNGPTYMYFLYPLSWEVQSSGYITNPSIEDLGTNLDIAFAPDEDNPVIYTQDNIAYRKCNIMLGRGTYRIYFE